jgi:hypothetical protein
MFEYVGVSYQEDVDLWVAEVRLEDSERNFPEDNLEILCQRFAVGMKYALKLGNTKWHEWVPNIGLSPQEFLCLAKIHVPSTDDSNP